MRLRKWVRLRLRWLCGGFDWLGRDDRAVVLAARPESRGGAMAGHGYRIADAVSPQDRLDRGRARARQPRVEVIVAFLTREPVYLHDAFAVGALESLRQCQH